MDVNVVVPFDDGLPSGHGTIIVSTVRIQCVARTEHRADRDAYALYLMIGDKDLTMGTYVSRQACVFSTGIMQESLDFLGGKVIELLARKILDGKISDAAIDSATRSAATVFGSEAVKRDVGTYTPTTEAN